MVQEESNQGRFVQVRVYLSSVTYFIRDQAYFIAIDSSRYGYNLLSLRRDSPSKIVPDFLCATL